MNYLTIKTILNQENKDNTCFSFEYDIIQVSVICDDNGKYFMRVYQKSCSAENNGSPVTTINDCAYEIDKNDCVTAENWRKYRNYKNRIELEFSSYSGVYAQQQ